MPRGLAAEQLPGAQRCPACNVLNSCTRLQCTPEAQNVRCAIIRGGACTQLLLCITRWRARHAADTNWVCRSNEGVLLCVSPCQVTGSAAGVTALRPSPVQG